MFFQKYKIQLFLIILLSVFIGIGQHYITGNPVTFIAVINHFFTLILAPVLFAAFIIGVMWYLGRKINSQKIFLSYLFSWVAVVIFSTITIIKVYA